MLSVSSLAEQASTSKEFVRFCWCKTACIPHYLYKHRFWRLSSGDIVAETMDVRSIKQHQKTYSSRGIASCFAALHHPDTDVSGVRRNALCVRQCCITGDSIVSFHNYPGIIFVYVGD
jgi:hypothetical protein